MAKRRSTDELIGLADALTNETEKPPEDFERLVDEADSLLGPRRDTDELLEEFGVEPPKPRKAVKSVPERPRRHFPDVTVEPFVFGAPPKAEPESLELEETEPAVPAMDDETTEPKPGFAGSDTTDIAQVDGAGGVERKKTVPMDFSTLDVRAGFFFRLWRWLLSWFR